MFDDCLRLYPSFDHLGPTASIVHQPAFETGIVKVLNLKEEELGPEEKDALECFERLEYLFLS